MGGLATGTAFRAQLYAAPGAGAQESALTPVGLASEIVAFRGGGNAGYVATTGNYPEPPPGRAIDPVKTVPTTGGPGGAVTLQIRAWSAGFASYEEALATGSTAVFIGKSGLFSLSSTGNPQAEPPVVPTDMVGFVGFNVAPVPEPSVIALGVLGLGALLMLRRRK